MARERDFISNLNTTFAVGALASSGTKTKNNDLLALVKKVWLLFDKRAKLDIRLTKKSSMSCTLSRFKDGPVRK